jgi:hypothetical protein
MVDLKYAKPEVRISISEGIETGAELYVLIDPGGDGTAQILLGITAASYQEGPHCDGEGFISLISAVL